MPVVVVFVFRPPCPILATCVVHLIIFFSSFFSFFSLHICSFLHSYMCGCGFVCEPPVFCVFRAYDEFTHLRASIHIFIHAMDVLCAVCFHAFDGITML